MFVCMQCMYLIYLLKWPTVRMSFILNILPKIKIVTYLIRVQHYFFNEVIINYGVSFSISYTIFFIHFGVPLLYAKQRKLTD